MEIGAKIAHEYCKQYRQHRVDEHRRLHSQERQCSGLNDREYSKVVVKQKTTFSKGKKFACTRLWRHNYVPRGEESLLIKTR